MGNQIEQGKTLYLTSFTSDPEAPGWEEKLEGRICLAKGFFMPTPDSVDTAEPFPVFIELNSILSDNTKVALKEEFAHICSIILEPYEFDSTAFDATYVWHILSKHANNNV
jgi:hypothetical protein